MTAAYLKPHPDATLTPELKVLRDRFESDFFENWLPFWDRFGVDHERGGFFCWLNEHGERLSDQKYMWYQGRGLWVYSHLYRVFGRNPAYLKIAEKTYQFLVEHGRDNDGFWLFNVGPNGEPIEPKDGLGYAGVFVAEGMQEFAHATGNTEALELSIDAFSRTLEIFNDPERHTKPDYLEHYYPGIRLLGMEMVIIRYLRQLMEHQEASGMREQIRTAIGHVFNEFRHPELKLNVEALDHNYQLPDDENQDFCLLGHSMETFWMIMDAGAFLGDDSIVDLAIERYHEHDAVSWNNEDRRYHTLYCPSRPVDETQVIWHYDEVIIANLMMYFLKGDQAAHDRALEIDARTEELFRLEGRNGPIWNRDVDPKGRPIFPMGRIGNYHTPRRWMVSLELLAKLNK
jgi:mannose/cellobiose epimerase-like protein (N-acyl-D-glucosamine 2-epimerase family)